MRAANAGWCWSISMALALGEHAGVGGWGCVIVLVNPVPLGGRFESWSRPLGCACYPRRAEEKSNYLIYRGEPSTFDPIIPALTPPPRQKRN
jgi:hypothetical protein